MSRRRRHPLLIAACLLLAPISSSSQAYELSREDYEAMGMELPAWDHMGRLPENDSRVYELQHIREQIDDRENRLRTSAFMLKLMEARADDPARYASLRADYASQQQSYARWRESAERRRQAILQSLAPASVHSENVTLAPDR
ncbi:MAG: hypothetical protein JWQ90_4807 [Hydrocarboniphaga sp.]|uniref:hypothetical protein n=1 Tax=Hydrocarboniphaga sp. TaxID=2033016 RepID=UPI00260E57EA|nr:hypothetical protein [Hydrocarboniphaga sp.]MDB5972357.1 hypothetical protein [Hydrocarboniphaga sp.]